MSPRERAPGTALLRLVAVLVPGHRRDVWRAEWEAELAHAWTAVGSGTPRRTRLGLWWRALGALPDALELRRQRGGNGMLGTDLRFAIRLLVRRPHFTAAVVVTLALGIGGAAAVYTVVDRLLLRPPPFAHVDRTVELHTLFGPESTIPVVMADAAEEWGRQETLFEAVEAYGYHSRILSGAGEPVRLRAALVTPGLLPLLGARPLFGSIPDAGAGPDEIVISEALWRTALQQDQQVLGRRLVLDDATYTVVGVLPDGFRYPAGEPQLWIPTRLGETGMHQVHAVARIQEGLSREQAGAAVMQLAARLQEERPGGLPWLVELRWLSDSHVRPELQRALWVLSGAVLLVLLIAAVNAANLLLVDTTRRDRELAIRGALGATRLGLVRQIMVESMMLGLLSAAAGLVVAYWLISVLLGLIPQEILLTSYHRIAVDGQVVVFAVALSALVAVVYSAWPAVRASRTAELVQSARATQGRGFRYTRNALVVAEVALSVVLVTAAGLLLNSFVRLSNAELGFQPQGLLAFSIMPRQGGDAFMEDLHARLTSLPGVTSVARGDAAPAEASMTYRQFILQTEAMQEVPEPITGNLPVVQVDTAYLRVIGARLRAGRQLLPEDATSGGVLINATLAQRLWPGESAVGNRFRASRREGDWWQVVGVIDDLKFLGPASADAPYLVLRHAPPERRGSYFVLRTSGDERVLADAVRATIRDLDAGLPLPEIGRITTRMRDTFAERRFFMLLIGSFAVVSMIMAVVGLYGVVSHSVTQRTREIGIRMALGARTSRVTREVVGDGAALVAAGVISGLVAAAAAVQLLHGLLFGVAPQDAPTFAIVAVSVTVVALLATALPARRAARVDPVVALRAE